MAYHVELLQLLLQRGLRRQLHRGRQLLRGLRARAARAPRQRACNPTRKMARRIAELHGHG